MSQPGGKQEWALACFSVQFPRRAGNAEHPNALGLRDDGPLPPLAFECSPFYV